MKIAFFANHDKTYFFAAVASKLRERGHDIRWISPGHRLAMWVRGQGYAAEHVLDLTTFASEWAHTTPALASGPGTGGDFAPDGMQIADMIEADRFLRTKSPSLAVRYLDVTSREIAKFVDREEIDVVLGEQTYAVELMANAVLDRRGVPFLAPATVRIPSDRFGLFPGPGQARLASDRKPDARLIAEAVRFVDEFRARPPKPYYFQRNQGGLRPELSWLWSPFKQLMLARRDPHELNRPTLAWLLRDRPTRVVNGFLAGRTRFAPPQRVLGADFVLFPLHRQPEASVDVLAYPFRDQAAVVEAIAGVLPPSWVLAVKEHSNGLGDRSPRFYRRLRRLPNVVLVDPWCEGLALARHARLTYALSGTLAYEAGILGHPAATAASMYFRDVLIGDGVNPFNGDLAALLRNVSDFPGVGTDASVPVAVARILANSEPGFIGAPSDTPECMEPRNLDAVAGGIERLLFDAGVGHTSSRAAIHR